MSGIVTYVGRGYTPGVVQIVRRVSERLGHRGPDAAGIAVLMPDPHESYAEDAQGNRTPVSGMGSGDPCTVVLASRRLALLDQTDAGHQPMWDREARRVVVLDGAIYNAVELRNELDARGHRFGSRSDAEVLLASYTEWGDECLQRLIGMFAFAIVDTRRGSVLLARDRFGMKPLFCAELEEGRVFASEVGALLFGAALDRQARPQRVVDYLVTGLTGEAEDTMFAAIGQILPASFITWSASDGSPSRQTRYWKPSVSGTLDIPFEESRTLVRDALTRSVELHIRGHRSVGVMLSGGTDSSALAVLTREVAGASVDIHTFSYIGEHGATSEEKWIDAVNSTIGAHPHKLRLEPGDWAGRGRYALHQGEPAASLAIFAQSRLYAMAREAGVRLALSGQGADKVFGGATVFLPARVTALLAEGRFVEAARFLRSLRSLGGPTDPVHRVAMRGLLPYAPHMLVDWLSRRRLRRPWIDPAYCVRHDIESSGGGTEPRGRHALQMSLLRSLEVALPPLLRYEDRSSTQHSAEGRLPYVTAALVELTLTLPNEHLVGGEGGQKRVLKEAMRGLVPDIVLARREKVSFDVPLTTWPALVPEIRSAFRSALSLPPANSPAMKPLLERVIARRPLAAREILPLWRLVGLWEWASDLDVIFD